MTFYLYMLTNRSRVVLYIGITNNLERRNCWHNNARSDVCRYSTLKKQLKRSSREVCRRVAQRNVPREPADTTRTAPHSARDVYTRIALRKLGYRRLGFAGRLSHHFVVLSHPDHFFDCRLRLGNPAPTVLP
jgi:hypothetical protein